MKAKVCNAELQGSSKARLNLCGISNWMFMGTCAMVIKMKDIDPTESGYIVRAIMYSFLYRSWPQLLFIPKNERQSRKDLYSTLNQNTF